MARSSTISVKRRRQKGGLGKVEQLKLATRLSELKREEVRELLFLAQAFRLMREKLSKRSATAKRQAHISAR